MKNSFILYTEYQDQLDLLTMEQRGVLLTAIMAYVSQGEMPDMDGMTKMAFSFIRANLDRDADKYQQTVDARREAGKQGGRPKANGFSEKQTKAKKANGFSEKQTKAKKPDNDNDNDNVNDNDNDNDNEKERSPKGDQKKVRFAPPSLDEVKAYAGEHGMDVDAERFIDFYQSKGWMVGRNPMKDWKAAVRNWARSQRQELTANGRQELTARKTAFNTYPQRQYDFDELEAQLLRAQE